MRASVLGGDDGSTTTLEPPSIAYLARSWDNLSSESPLKVARVMEWHEGSEGVRGRGSGSPQHPMMRASVVGDGAGSNYHFRAAKLRVLDTLLGQSKLRITLGGRVESHRVVW